MSYILEALKKSEQERNPDRVPDISSHHEQIVMAPKKTFPWVWFVVILIIINLLTFYWLFFQKPVQPTEITQVRSEPVIEQPEQSVMDQPVITTAVPVQDTVLPGKESENEVVEKPNSSVSEQTESVQPIKEVVQPPPTTAPLKFSELPHISELAIAIQEQIPALSFTTHVYVTGGGGFVIINDRNLSDGMSLGSGLVLEKIVPEGIILSFRDRAFTVNAMESWNTN